MAAYKILLYIVFFTLSLDYVLHKLLPRQGLSLSRQRENANEQNS